MTSLTKKYLINGPITAIRLCNKNKILYIFGDQHNKNQTECKYSDSNDSIDIDKFLLLFMKSNKTIRYDIFCEMNENMYEDFDINYKVKQLEYNNIYIYNVFKLFQSNIKDKYKNFKFHYTDIRSSLLLFRIIEEYYHLYIYNTKYIGKIYITLLEESKILILTFIKLLDNNKFIKKIINRYNHIKIKKKICNIYKYILYYSKEIINIIDNLIIFIKKNLYTKIINFNDDTNNYIIIKIDKITELISYIGVLIIDLYFIRRFLDKDYINNVILYTGTFHLINISYLLVKYFDFKITHINYLHKTININNYISKLSNKDLMKNIYELENILLNKNILYQCTNLFNFPDDFT
jgi:hypothetical protein